MIGPHPQDHPTRRTTDVAIAAPPPAWKTWGAALLLFTVAYLITDLTWPLLQPAVFMLFFGAVALTAWYSGRPQAFLVILLTIAAVAYRFYEPFGRLVTDEPGAWVRLIGYAGISALITEISNRLRKQRTELIATLDRVSTLNVQLHERVEMTQTQAAQLEEQAAEMEEQQTELEEQFEHALELNTQLEDVSEREREARHVAEHASQAKSEFLTVMSHELRTPLNAIIGYGELLSSEVGGSLTERQKEYVAHTNRAAWHLLQLIEQILSLSRIEAGQELITMEEFELDRVVREGAELIRPLAERKGVACQLSLPGEPIRVRSDPGKVRQILINLMGNATKFTERGRISIEVKQDTTVAFVNVTDTGIGIASANLERIFEPFVQVDASPTRPRGGTGLGLPVSLRLAHLLGGDLTVQSNQGVGSSFTLILPLQPAPDGKG